MNEWLLMQSDVVIVSVIFGLLLSGAIGFPPEDFTLVLAGIILHEGKGEIETFFLVCYIGTIIGDLFIYFVGRKFGKALYNRPWVQKKFRPGRVKLVRKALERRSLPTIFVARHLFYLRTLTFLTCGAVKMRFMRFFISDCVSALVSVPLMLWLGYQASEHYDVVYNFIKNAKLISLVIAIGIIIAVYWAFRKYEHVDDGVEVLPSEDPLEDFHDEDKKHL